MKWAVISIFLLSIIYVHFRGKVRLPFFRQLFDHSSIMAPLNILMYLFSKVPTNTAYLPTSAFSDLKILEDNWETIRDEAQALIGMEKIRAAAKNDDAGFNSFFKAGWKRFYLKWYDASHPSAEQFCPKTVALLRRTPSVKAAMFAELGPGGKLNLHRDPFAGSMRYHLGLITPNDDRCFIEVNGERHSWRDGQGVVFDETFMHWAHNGTDINRIIIFCDIERPMKYRWAQAVNRWLGRHMMSAAASPNDTGDQTGGINKLFRFVWAAGQYRRALKKFSKPLYYVVKFGLIIGVIAAIIWL
ncbi:lipid A hydroxylase LpxO [Glaciimonas sp. PAMC28666]|uniref:lipid A hydroxylase LpxO n=1 Tax=Glaciimonas sp. PAMC28666 TaxID=2807626 RepID=UPI001965B305|nr:lipid A hydroxylase LpxO [Glaciimonas sp. PAMC28666]QRX81467.1 lipid A hydroxylase LpxO [Glaciimonas sp. PAMC28666]